MISNFNGTNIACFNGHDGQITLNASAPAGNNFNYKWSTTNGSGVITSSPDQTSLSAGTYTVTITDAKGCEKDTVFILTQPASALSLTINQIQDILCHGNSTGKLEATGSGGTPFYTYLWSNGKTTPVIDNLKGGNYTLELTDINHCKTTENYNITQPDTIKLIKKKLSYPYCSATQDGEIEINPKWWCSSISNFVGQWSIIYLPESAYSKCLYGHYNRPE